MGLKKIRKWGGGGEEIAEWDPSAPLTPAFHSILVQTANTHDEIIFMQSLFFPIIFTVLSSSDPPAAYSPHDPSPLFSST